MGKKVLFRCGCFAFLAVAALLWFFVFIAVLNFLFAPRPENVDGSNAKPAEQHGPLASDTDAPHVQASANASVAPATDSAKADDLQSQSPTEHPNTPTPAAQE